MTAFSDKQNAPHPGHTKNTPHPGHTHNGHSRTQQVPQKRPVSRKRGLLKSPISGTCLFFCTRPRPEQVPQYSSMISPVPWHCGHALCCCSIPSGVRTTCITTPCTQHTRESVSFGRGIRLFSRRCRALFAYLAAAGAARAGPCARLDPGTLHTPRLVSTHVPTGLW